ncbi:hypothetical protein [Capnocytophaga leadbetteri]|uniref:hypothetical protein n=1 Tax=Capnocytophaga leadbetteri TaxID=327575 RepID=UPI0028EF9E07|nr:hypothetical protein [Capnocytophaga leadbetteri]
MYQKIRQFLNEHPNNIVTVTQGKKRLAKDTMPKYGFTLADITKLYGTVEAFILSLPAQGFGNGTRIDLRRLYGSGASQSSYKHDTFTLNFKEKETDMTPELIAPTAPASVGENGNLPAHAQPSVPQQAPAAVPPAMGYPQQAMGMPMQMGLGYTPVATTDWITSKVIEERYRDLQRDNDNLREDNKDLRSQVRTLSEEKAALRLQLDTADKAHELKIKEELLNKQSFWESKGFERVSETLGAVIPMVVERMAGASASAAAATPALAAPQLSAVKQEFIKIISAPNITDEQIGALYEQLMQTNDEQQTASPQEIGAVRG